MVDVPMSDADIRRWLPGTPVILYSQFARMKTLDEVLAPNGQCVFLYEWRPREGHWCCLWRRGKAIHVFDPLGFMVDKELAHVEPRYRHQLNEDRPYLKDLLLAAGCPVFYNGAHLQLKTTAVCGRECIVRLAFKALNEDAYAAMWGGIQPDAIIARVIR